MPARLLGTSAQELEQAVKLLKSGGVGAFPTDTVYGLGARIDREEAVRRVFRAKGRSYSQPLPVLIAELSQLSILAREVPPLAWTLAQRFWPGALTLVLPKAPAVSSLLTAGGDSVALRLPAHPVPLALTKGLGIPLIGTSANRSGEPAPVAADGVMSALEEELDFIIDGGLCPGSRESTIIDLTQRPPRILREGAIPAGEIEEVCASLLEPTTGATSLKRL